MTDTRAPPTSTKRMPRCCPQQHRPRHRGLAVSKTVSRTRRWDHRSCAPDVPFGAPVAPSRAMFGVRVMGGSAGGSGGGEDCRVLRWLVIGDDGWFVRLVYWLPGTSRGCDERIA